eukprot:TRINITY_DN2626_c0_g1_i1.p1 TRINITY_DN2626_c0_g1~~TRINITY_DN2626_c0_g1_i1.p1  ORF type:complete len:380 (+),score=94.89 TRINITY_DN2626_c0_g1_i1:25-1140(+)
MQCGKCKKPIAAGQFLEALGQKLHPDCFACGKCAKPIGASKFANENGTPYHLDCLAELKGDICSKCNKPVTNSLTVLDKKFHPECFVCGGCGKNIEGGQVSVKDNTPFHPPCLPPSSPSGASGAVPKVLCGGCEKPIVAGGKFLTAVDKTWHPECFKCAKCKGPISDAEFKVDKTKVYHAKCSAGPEIICKGCSKPITDRKVLDALDTTWHPGCFKCLVCSKLIDGGSYKTKDGHPVHPECKEDEFEITETWFTSKEPGAEAITTKRMVKSSELEAAKNSTDIPSGKPSGKAPAKAKASASSVAKPASPRGVAKAPAKAGPLSPSAKTAHAGPASPKAGATTAAKTAAKAPASPRGVVPKAPPAKPKTAAK